ncbi:SIS domain-containing protein [Rhodospirillaceae bacterium SYSU D60014]|uniref:SIS domain-containing protein n=1 Tax=Virgifigura deserti TaxID=2268457 RepID=UPI000E66CCC8
MPHLWQEIAEQPDIVARLLERERNVVERIAARIRDRPPPFVLIAARGTSDNAARYAQYVFGAMLRLPVALAAPSLFTVAEAPPRLDGALVIGISQSGQSPDIAAVMRAAADQSCVTVAITNDPSAPVASATDEVLALEAGIERSVAATKTYVASLAALALLAAAAEPAERRSRYGALDTVPEALRRTLDRAGLAATEAAAWPGAGRAISIGRGFHLSTAHEAALKLKELTYVAVEAFSSADFRHGPIVMIEDGFPVLAVIGNSAFDQDVAALAETLRVRQAKLLTVGPSGADLPFDAPAAWLEPLTAILPGQLLAGRIAERAGIDVDRPRGLSKVTRTI